MLAAKMYLASSIGAQNFSEFMLSFSLVEAQFMGVCEGFWPGPLPASPKINRF
jgi:hypothetical protein